MSDVGNLSSYLGMPIITSRNVPVGSFIIIDRCIYTSLTIDQLMVKLWVADAIKLARAHLRSLVAEVEARWFGPEL